MDETVGRRERKKAATREALHRAALRLAAEQGPDRVTVEAIADAADVSRRTFSNYFANKEEALFHADLVRIRRLLELVHAQPLDEPPWTALTRAAEQLARESDGLDPLWLAQRRLIRNHPSLAAHQITAYGAVEQEFTAEIARRLPEAPETPLRARVLAGTFLHALRAATQHWTDHPERPLVELVRAALGYVTP
ncbi:TetR/AcrR family transcriptional regulator [Plantactinospora sp. KLBMP9567]|uniref:TetR/AcrR family transcriptional regulator n=1 Tax=Plantactinospora sp. KLBMP9567 TaxID=3085900 RepID=UPI0029821EEB|nr:TetR family transcriptional regulator [Plantactinospora sp. KLBMP9567]MDW5324218.1 TetR family transcriptional regulator [Plantactinospora sp. KLBMP9567]